MRRSRSNSAESNALDVVPHYPVLTINRLAVGHLTSLGILEERTGCRRNRIFVNPEALAVINRPFGAEPNLPAELDDAQGQ